MSQTPSLSLRLRIEPIETRALYRALDAPSVRDWCVLDAFLVRDVPATPRRFSFLMGSIDDKFEEILAGLPENRQRSRLAPYGNLIGELRRRGLTFRYIAQMLAEKCQLTVASSTIVRFARARSRAKESPSKCQPPKLGKNAQASTRARIQEKPDSRAAIDMPAVDVVYQRIAALKQRQASIQNTAKLFHYDPTEPLHLSQRTSPKKIDE